MASPSILRIERLNYGIAAVAIAAAALTQSQPVALGFAVGSGLTCLNFFVLRKLVVKWTRNAASGNAGMAQILMLPKMVGLMGAVAVAILFLPIDVIAFVVGYSIFLPSIVVDTVLSAMRPDPADLPPPPNEPSEHNHG